MQADRISALLKFASKEHVDDFVKGNLYMNTLGYFAHMEAEQQADLRRDSFEGVGALRQADGAILSMEVDGEFQPVLRIKGAIKWWPPAGIQANVFCMHALLSSSEPELIDERNFHFGDTFAVVRDGDEFLRRLKVAGEHLGMGWQLVEYVDEQKHNGAMGVFRKRSVFSYQSEFRIALKPGLGKPLTVKVGDLSDIVSTGPIRELKRRLVRMPVGN